MGEEWSSNANDAVRISLVQPSAAGVTELSTFHPKFTYPIFGEEERIFGYQNLEIYLRFVAHDLRPNLQISYDKKFQAVGETRALDLNKTLKDWIPKSAFQKAGDFDTAITDGTGEVFTPPGRLVHSYLRKGRKFEVWAGPLSDPAVKAVLDRIQIFISFYIEGGTPLNTDDVDWTLERWTIYFVYEKQATSASPKISPYSFVGYATTYRFYTFNPTSKSDLQSFIPDRSFLQTQSISVSQLPSRLRISQFLILPPHQHYGHGSELYNTIFEISLSDSNVHELTVEDPNEEFDLIRDVNDYARLLPEFISHNVSINPDPYPSQNKRPPKKLPTSSILPLPTLTTLRLKYKIAPRQFSRLTEMYLLSKIPSSSRVLGGANLVKLKTQKHRISNIDDRTYYWWRLLVKQRIYKKNKDMLIQLDVEERYQKLDETAIMQEGEYELIMAGMEDRRKKIEGEKGGDDGKVVTETGAGSVARKRKLIEDDDEDEDEDEEDDSKRLKT